MNEDRHETSARIAKELAKLDFNDVKPVEAGEQNFVYTCSLHLEDGILKVTDARHRSLVDLQAQTDMLSALKQHSTLVCAPVEVREDQAVLGLTVDNLTFYVTAYPFAVGETVDITNPEHAHLMGRSLAHLHSALRILEPYPFRQIGTQDTRTPIERLAQQTTGVKQIYDRVVRHFDAADRQLLHGDFNAGNLKIKAGQVTVFDFDNCAYGSTTYELADALYMVLFDQATRGELPVYIRFRETFLQAYQEASELRVEGQTIDDLIGYRVLTLASWLAEPGDAPLFIRQSSAAWLSTLNGFVKTYFTRLVNS